ncbi:MAG: ribose 5-phosphate isomerase B [Deltaproteobacteria bacterium]|nr:ribose 5-phosphate isomerase B [Deltaproteobacteria bacterium]MBW1948990.1 ribose 5-phosphate isomerase B [Deltaproteobacteria bacterium]MBW2006994.1 ribose 5-phosphate isomerase B [Deltaproteobacteria bacterium]MBW2348770.1 ribose 5-phosphate isomerase B [Deltaproteobacteria bacterium]
MRVVLGSDHAGFDLKEACRVHLLGQGKIEVKDAGVFNRDSADYPPIAHEVSRAVSEGEARFGILICGTGLGMSMVANRHRGVRAALCHELFTTRMSRLHNDANVLVMGGRVIGVGLALEMVDLFLATPFEGGRHTKRIAQFE